MHTFKLVECAIPFPCVGASVDARQGGVFHVDDIKPKLFIFQGTHCWTKRTAAGFLFCEKSMNLKQNQKNIVNDAIIREIIEALNNLKYGEIKIIVHNSKIVQIDKIQKTRFDAKKGGE